MSAVAADAMADVECADPEVLVVDGPQHDATAADELTMHRALVRAGRALKTFCPEPALAGYAWYDALPRVTGLRIEVSAGGGEWTLPEERERFEGEGHRQAERITCVLRLRRSDESRDELRLASDVAFGMLGPEEWIEEAEVTLTHDAKMAPDELAELLVHAGFSACRGDEGDAESQETEYRRRARRIATELLVSTEAARRQWLEGIARERLSTELRRGESVRVAREDNVTVEITTNLESA